VIEKDQAVLEIRERDALEKDEVKEGGGMFGVEQGEGVGKKSCNRLGDKSLYLVVKKEGEGWRFPGGDGRQVLEGREEGRPEYLHEVRCLVFSFFFPRLSPATLTQADPLPRIFDCYRPPP